MIFLILLSFVCTAYCYRQARFYQRELETEREISDFLAIELGRRDSGGCKECRDRAAWDTRARKEAQEMISRIQGGW